MSYLIDLRCPCCNRPVIGRKDVTNVKSLPVVTECQHCTAYIDASSAEELGMGTLHFFAAKVIA